LKYVLVCKALGPLRTTHTEHSTAAAVQLQTSKAAVTLVTVTLLAVTLRCWRQDVAALCLAAAAVAAAAVALALATVWWCLTVRC
jgi:hypothetical protein